MPDSDKPLVHLVDDDEAVRRSVEFMLKTSGFQVKSYISGAELLISAGSIMPGCILLDVRMPGMDGIQVLQKLRENGVALPVIIMTGHGDIPLAVQAMKEGALHFIEKPFGKGTLLPALEEGRGRLKRSAATADEARDAATRLQVLTPREREVLDCIARGLPNKLVAYELEISPRTVEVHRAKLMAKLGARSFSEVLRMTFMAQAVEH